MSKYFEPLKMWIPKADELGHKLGASLPKIASQIIEAAKRHKLLPADLDMADLPEPIKKMLPELIEMAGGGIEIPRDKLPAGPLGDVAHDYLNEIVDAMGRGAHDKMLHKDGKTDAKGAAKTSDKDGGTPADPKARLGFVLNGRWYPANCTHVSRPFTGKGNKAPDDITLEEALARKHGYCQDCVRDLVPVAAKSDAASDAKTPPKTDEPKIPEPECKLVSADHTLFDLWEMLRDDDEKLISAGKQAQHNGKRDDFVLMTQSDPELLRKFFEAFHGRGTYEQFRRVVLYADKKHWKHELDMLLGKTKEPESAFQRETRETNAAIATFTKWIKDGAPKRKAKLDERKLRLAELEAIRAGDKKKAKEIKAQLAEIRASR